MTRKQSSQTKRQTPSTTSRRKTWLKPRRQPSRSALISFAHVGLLGTQFV